MGDGGAKWSDVGMWCVGNFFVMTFLHVAVLPIALAINSELNEF